MNKNESLEMMKMTDYCSTCHCEGVRKHDCCNPEKNPTLQTGLPRSLPFARNDRKVAFTLAETLITLTILGVIAAITVPMLINKQMEAANRTKLKKAMAAYEKALNQMIVDNDIKSGPISAIEGFRATDNCSTSTKYFKKINGDGCRFQTADKVYWDITDIEHPVISLKDQLTDAMVSGVKSNSDDYKDDKTLFSMTGEITNGLVRINDQADTGLSTEAKANLDKIYAFINKDGSSSTVSGGGEGTTEKCTLKEGSETEYSCTGSELTWKKQTVTEQEATAASYTNKYLCNWDPEKNKCDALPDNTSTAQTGELFVSEPLTLTEADAKSTENCATSRSPSFCALGGDYWNLARRKCDAEGGRLPTAAELKAMYNKGGQLDSSSRYWAAEAYSNATNISYDFSTFSGIFSASDVDRSSFTDSKLKAVCVGN